MKRRLLLVGLIGLVAAGALVVVAMIHDRGMGLSEDALRARVPVGSTEQEASTALSTLAADPPGGTEISQHPAEFVSQEPCSPRPCSLVDRGVPEGYREITVRVKNGGHWLPDVCTDQYIAAFVFDGQAEYCGVFFTDASACP